MIRQALNSIRGYLGGIALGVGCLGLLLFAVAIPFTLFEVHFWVGMGFREGPQPTYEQLQAAVDRDLWWCVLHRLLPLFVISIALISYGFYEACKEKERNP